MAQKKNSFTWTSDQVRDHCRRTGEDPAIYLGGSSGPESSETKPAKPTSLIPPDGMNKTEREFSRILESKARRGEITGWAFEAIRLKWGKDPNSGAAMRYLADFVVFHGEDITMIEVKGGKIWDRDIVRWKGCRAEWPQFKFEFHQKTRHEGWRRIH